MEKLLHASIYAVYVRFFPSIIRFWKELDHWDQTVFERHLYRFPLPSSNGKNLFHAWKNHSTSPFVQFPLEFSQLLYIVGKVITIGTKCRLNHVATTSGCPPAMEKLFHAWKNHSTFPFVQFLLDFSKYYASLERSS